MSTKARQHRDTRLSNRGHIRMNACPTAPAAGAAAFAAYPTTLSR